MSVDHGGFDILVTEEFLNRSYVVAGLEEVGGEGVAEGVGSDLFINSCGFGGLMDGFLEGGLVEVVAAET